MRWTWAILLLAGGRAERRVVVEDFAKAGLWTDEDSKEDLDV